LINEETKTSCFYFDVNLSSVINFRK